MSRKQCADCGQRSLETEASCWACGGSRFMIPGVSVAGEPTISFDSASEMTMSWPAPRSVSPWSYVGIAGAMAVLMSLAGFWAGRASASKHQGHPEPAEPALSRPVPLPQPPRPAYQPMPMGADPGSYSQSSPRSSFDPGMVTVRSRPVQPAPSSRPANEAAPGVAAVPTPSVVYRVPSPQPSAPPPTVVVPPTTTPRISTQVRADPTPPPARRAPEPERPSPPPAPTRETAVVALRNDSSSSVEVDVEGNGSRTARVSPGATVQLRLPSGSYRLRAKSDGAAAANSTLAVQSNRTYSLLVGRQKEAGRDILVLIEPLEPDFD